MCKLKVCINPMHLSVNSFCFFEENNFCLVSERYNITRRGEEKSSHVHHDTAFKQCDFCVSL